MFNSTKSLEQVVDSVRAGLVRHSALAMGRTWPNPPVSCVVVLTTPEKTYLFSGGTEKPGKRHAEIVALDDVDVLLAANPNLDSQNGCTAAMYVSLEPCSTHGRTPPCVNRIRSYDFLKKIRIYTMDPLLKGEGVKILSENKRVLVNDDSSLGAKFFGSFLHGFLMKTKLSRPRLHIKVACDERGMVGRKGEGVRVSGDRAHSFTMLLRAKCDAVLVGPGTVASDLPRLDFRMPKELDLPKPNAEWITSVFNGLSERDPLLSAWFEHSDEIFESAKENVYQPARLFLLERAFSASSDFFRLQKKLEESTNRPTFYFSPHSRVNYWRKRGIEPIEVPEMSDIRFGSTLMRALGELGMNEVLIEGGPRFIDAISPAFLGDDRFYELRSKKQIEGLDIPTADSFRKMTIRETVDLGDDLIRFGSLFQA